MDGSLSGDPDTSSIHAKNTLSSQEGQARTMRSLCDHICFDVNQEILPIDLSDCLIETYFKQVHRWIPILHQTTFRQKLQNPEQRKSLNILIHAIIAVTVRFSDNLQLKDYSSRERLSKICRQNVIMKSMEIFSVENLQALVIIAFDAVSVFFLFFA